jgi:mannose-6-phosphate isomerase
MTKNPIMLSPDLFTPLSKTPWAGCQLAKTYKKNVVKTLEHPQEKIGESWEFSCDPSFASTTKEHGLALNDMVRQYPIEILSPKYANKKTPSCEILVKLINADSPLSLQVHPTDDDPNLASDECGKPESWLVLDAEPGAGLYLGFSRAVSPEDLEKALCDGEKAKDLLQFVPVKPGDYFEIEPGVPHAIGPGVTLLEPQRIRFGFSGKTYRLWDWGRRYDDDGNLDFEAGKPRQLHIREAMRIIKPEQQVGMAFVESLQRKGYSETSGNGAFVVTYPENSYYQLRMLSFTKKASISLTAEAGYGVFVNLGKPLTLKGKGEMTVAVDTGHCLLIPFDSWPLEVSGQNESKAALITPSGAGVSFLKA